MASVTLKDIAREANVTPATVSMVINNKPNISIATKERVMQIAKRLNYYPNVIARGLATRRSNAIGVIVPNLASSFVMRVLEGVKSTLRKIDHTLILFDTIGRTESEFLTYQRVVREGRVDGVLIITSGLTADEMQLLSEEKTPCIAVACKSAQLDCIYVNNHKGSLDAVRYLVQKGHKDIALITIEKRNLNISERIAGYQEAQAEANIELKPDLIFSVTDDKMSDGAYIVPKIIDHPRKPTAVFCPAGDMVAIGVVKELRRRGVKVPQEIAVVGYDDIPAAEVIEPALTTVRQPKLEMGDTAINMIMDKIEGREKNHVIKELNPKFIIRESA
jgi:DNA-binding LacI/PurR family transcriptional regulator